MCGCLGFCVRVRVNDGISLHGPPYALDDVVHIPYGAAGLIVLDITEQVGAKTDSQLNFCPLLQSPFGLHGALPIPDRISPIPKTFPRRNFL
jgi:hypothetical protein